MSALGWQLVTVADAQNPVVGDLRIVGTRLARLATLAESVEQAVRVRLQWWRGHWFLDVSRGVPFLEELFGKGVSVATIEAILTDEVEATEGVARVTLFVLEQDAASRVATATIELLTTDGALLTLEGVEVGT